MPVEAVERALHVSNDYGMVAVRPATKGRRLKASSRSRPSRASDAGTGGTVADALDEWDGAAVE
ncbi:hypothetical protein C8039_02375 [Halogeometricum sp. wsp3]|nr:hypothetical protein C8039_02375 [Halogeometricum sp. wsp3]